MQALVFHGPHQLSVEEVPDPTLDHDEVLLSIVMTGICGSDLHGYTGENGRRQAGQVMGHETAAVVAADPSGTFAEGSLVTINPVVGCGQCPSCASGQTQNCADRRVFGVTPQLSSAFAQHMVVPRGNVVPLADGVPPEIGATVEPLSVGYHAALRGGITHNDAVLVIGGGPIGQSAALGARRLGSRNVIVSEMSPSRRNLVEALGFETVDPQVTDVANLGLNPEVVIDAVGSSRTIDTALTTSRPGARIVLVGMQQPQLSMSAYAISTEERTIHGSFCYTHGEFEETAEWASDHADEIGVLVDRVVELSRAPEAFRNLTQGTWTASKVLVRMPSATTSP